MNAEFLAVLEQMERDRGISKDTLFAVVEQSILDATKKSQGPSRDLRVTIDRKNGDVKAFARLTVVSSVKTPCEQITLSEARKQIPSAIIGQTLELEVTPKDMGRIAAQAVKQGIMQAIRGEEKRMVYAEFKDRAGDIVTGTVRRFVKSDVVVDLGKFEGIMPHKERVPTEDYNVGDRIRALVLSVEMLPRGPQITLTRSHPSFVRRLFELECNELTNGTVEIKAMAREAGYRTKIAVVSKQEKVDPVGACVGIRGSRVKNIVRELNNERVDIFRWSDNKRELIIEALKPAKLKDVQIDPVTQTVVVVVEDEDNLSLAIGKKGQNARLTEKLTGLKKVDIRLDESKQMEFQRKQTEAAEKIEKDISIPREDAMAAVVAGLNTVELIKENLADLADYIPDGDAAKRISDAVAKTGGGTA